MSDQAQAEFNQYFNHRDTNRSHPEDVQWHSAEDDHNDSQAEPRHEDEEDSDFADEAPPPPSSAARESNSRNAIPTRREYANTGVKGVIADAQAYEAAKRQMRSWPTAAREQQQQSDQQVDRPWHESWTSSHPDANDLGLNEDEDVDEDDEFTKQWRQQRMQELQAQSQGRFTSGDGRFQHHGAFTKLSAEGYLDIVEKSPAEVFVVVLLWDYSEASQEVEDELKQLAYRHGRVRFIGLRWDVAEIQYLAVPSVLVYRGGDVVATLDGVQSDAVAGKLKQVGVLPAT